MIALLFESYVLFTAQMNNELYVLDLIIWIYNINTKRMRSNELNPIYFWNYCLGLINEKYISEFYKDGLL